MIAPNQFFVSPLSYGAKYDGKHDDADAHEAMFAHLYSLPADIKQNYFIQLPAGTSFNSRALHISTAFVIQGVGVRAEAGSARHFGTRLEFADGSHGVIIDSRASSTTTPSFGGDWCVLKDIFIMSRDKSVPHKHGLTLRARAHVENVIVSGFSGDGFHIVSASDGNVDDANRLWSPNHEYSDGDWVNAVGHDKRILDLPLPEITFEVIGKGIIELKGWNGAATNNVITGGDILIIPNNSVLANSNTPLYWQYNTNCWAVADGTNIVHITNDPVNIVPDNSDSPKINVGDFISINGVESFVLKLYKDEHNRLVHQMSKAIPASSPPPQPLPKVAFSALANAGMYLVGGALDKNGKNWDGLEPPTPGKLQAIKICDYPLDQSVKSSKYPNFVDSGFFAAPVSLYDQPINAQNQRVLTKVQAIEATDAYILTKVDNRLVCVKAGRSDNSSQYLDYKRVGHYPDKTSLNDGTVIWKDGLSTGNANNWYLQYCRSEENGRHGFFVQGDVTNAGCAVQCDASVNKGWGFFDNSFLGNTWIACHAATNDSGPYRTSSHGNCHSTFIGCYSEADQPPSLIHIPSMSLGGIMAAGFADTSSGFRLDATWEGPEMSSHYVKRFYNGKAIKTTIGISSEAASIFGGVAFSHTDDPVGFIMGGYNDTIHSWTFGKTNYPPSFEVLGGIHSNIFRPSSGLVIPAASGNGGQGDQPGVFILATNGYPLLGNSGSNSFCPGTLILNQNAANDGIKGWICTQKCGSGYPWIPSDDPHYPGSTKTPSTPNGFVYRSALDRPAQIGSSEPSRLNGNPWPTKLGDKVQDGSMIWECFGHTDNGLEEIVTQ
jgi:hypothetical protein